MKRFKRVLQTSLAALLMLALLLPTALCATSTESPAPDPSPSETPTVTEGEPCSLTLVFYPGKKAASGVTFSIYRVADVFPEQVKFQSLEGYRYNVLEGTGTWAEKANTLKGYVERDNKEPTAKAATDAEGKVSFPDLEQGIYLVLGTQSGDLGGVRYTPAPVLLTLPAFSEEANGWVTRDLEANIKSYNSETVSYPSESPKYLAVDVRWNDNNNEAGERPESVIVELYHKTTGKVIHTVTVKQGEDWYYKWKDPWGDLEARIKDASRDDLISRNYNQDTFDEYDMTEKGDTRTYILTLTLGDIDIDDPDTPLHPGDESLRVLKVWEDDNDAAGVRPDSITVDLLANGEVYDTVELSSGTNWRYTWIGLDEKIEWQVVEREQSYYTVNVTTNGVTQVITNTYSSDITDDKPPLIDLDDPDVPLDPGFPFDPGIPPTDLNDPQIPLNPGTPDDPSRPAVPGGPDVPDENPPLAMLPQTGLLWWPVPVMALLGAALILLGYARRRRSVS